jgi:inner membrane protein
LRRPQVSLVNPITHLLVGWTLAEQTRFSPRDRKIVTWAGVVPDLDGLVLVGDVANRLLGRPEADLYQQYHHMLTHGLPAALVAAGVAFGMGTNRLKTALFAFAAFHLHLLCDLVGSRGPDPSDVWPIPYLQPVSSHLTIQWTGQWELTAWPNVAFSVVLLGLLLVRAVRRGYSPVSLFSASADRTVVATLRARFQPESGTSH